MASLSVLQWNKKILAVYKGQGEKKKNTRIVVLKGNSSYMFAAVSAVLNMIVDNAIPRPVWEKLWDFHPEAFYPAHHSVTPHWGLQAFSCRTERDPNSHLPGLQQASCAKQIRQNAYTLVDFLFRLSHTPLLLPFTHSGIGQWQDKVSLLVSKRLCPS